MKAIEIHYQSQRSVRARGVLWLLEKHAPLHGLLNKKRHAWGLCSDDLMAYPQGSLGYSLGVFYKKEKFEPIARAERHDVFHVLFGYSTQVIDEAAMQFFLWGNGKGSLFTIGTCVISAFVFPNKIAHFIRHYKKGGKCIPVKDWNFKFLLTEDLRELRQKFILK